MTAYYNEIDPKAAAWLRELIRRNLIAPGDVDERSIEDVHPDDLRPYTQCHFFAGIGVWSHSLRRAGWADDWPVWTGSCPCQPFSAAGKGEGFADERHLWPAWHHLIRECRPDVIYGEQVASKDGLGWLDLVHADLEGEGYAFGPSDTCSAGFGAPHIRQRLRFVAERLDDTAGARRFGPLGNAKEFARNEARLRLSGAGSENGGLGYASLSAPKRQREHGRQALPVAKPEGPNVRSDATCGVADTCSTGLEGQDECAPAERSERLGRLEHADSAGSSAGQRNDSPAGHRLSFATTSIADELDDRGQPGPTNGFWRDADWLFCRDERWRPVEPGTFPLAHGAPARVVRLRGYGNAVDAEATARFIEAYLETKIAHINGERLEWRDRTLLDLM